MTIEIWKGLSHAAKMSTHRSSSRSGRDGNAGARGGGGRGSLPLPTSASRSTAGEQRSYLAGLERDLVGAAVSALRFFFGVTLGRGEQPVLAPGEVYEYTSGTPLPTPSGIVVGSYQMQDSAGWRFDVAIPAFSLDSPHQAVGLNQGGGS